MHFLTYIFLLFTPGIIFCQPEINFKKKVHKFPKTKEGITLEHDFLFTNTGNEPLIINNIKVSCTCTKFTYADEAIKPGKSSSIHVTFDTNKKYDWQDRKLIIMSNAKNNPETIRFKVMVDNK